MYSQIQNEDSRSLDSANANRQSVTDKETLDPDEESNTYNNTAYSSTGEVDDDTQSK